MQRMTKLNGLDIIDLSRGVANGVASLNEQGRIPDSQIPTVHNADDLQLKESLPISLLDWRNHIGEAYVWKDTMSWAEYLNDNIFSNTSVAIKDDIIVYAKCEQITTARTRVIIYKKYNNTTTQVYQFNVNVAIASIVTVEMYYCGATAFSIRVIGASGTGIDEAYLSLNEGVSWSHTSEPYTCVAYHNGIYIGISYNVSSWLKAYVLRSTDGVTFTRTQVPQGGWTMTTHISYEEGVWFIASNDGSYLLHSIDDGVTWSIISLPTYEKVLGPVFSVKGTVYVCCGEYSIKLYRLATPTANSLTLTVTNTLEGNILYANGYWYASNQQGTLRRAKILGTWETCTVPVTLSSYIIEYTNGRYFLITSTALYTSTDGITFTLLRTLSFDIQPRNYTNKHNAPNNRKSPFVYYRHGIWIILRYGSYGFSWSSDLIEWHDISVNVFPEYPNSALIDVFAIVSKSGVHYNSAIPLIH